MAPDAPGGDILALNIPPDLAALPSRVRGLSGATVRRLVAAHGPEVVRRAVATIEQSYPNKAAIRVFGALLQRTIAEGWMSTQQEEQTKKETQEAAIVAAAPPDGTRWAERDGQVLEVLEVSTSAVRTATGVIPRSNWPEWTFRIDEPPVSVPSPATPTEGASPLDHEERVETLRKMKAMPMTRRLAAKLATEWGIDLGAV